MSGETKPGRLGVSIPLLCGILASFGDDAINTAIMPLIASVSAAFPDIPYTTITWLYSMPKLVIIPFALLSGYLVGRKVKFKTMALLGMGIISIAGVLPAFLTGFWEILASRMLLAVGLGLQAPIGPALAMRYFRDGSRRSLVLGLGNGVLNGANIVTSILIGNLCLIDWHLAFLSYGFMAVLFLVTLVCLKEPPAAEPSDEGSPEPADHMRKAPIAVVALCALFAAIDCVWMPASMNISSVLSLNGWGDSATAGYLISLISAAGFVAGVLYGPYCRLARRYNISSSLFLMSAAVALIFFATGVAMIAAGLFLGGAAFCLIICGVQNEIGGLCDPSQMAFATALFMVFEHLGGFLSSWWMALVMGVFGPSAYLAPAGVAIVFFLIMGVGFAFYGKFRSV